MYKLITIFIFSSSVLFAQEFKLKSITGETYHIDMTASILHIKEFPKKIILLDFFGANCKPCIKEFPELIEFQNSYKNDIQIIAIQSSSSKDDKEMIKFSKKHKLNYPIINLKEANELIIFTQKQIEWNGAIPFKLLYNRKGILAWKLYGMMSLARLEGVIKEK